VDAADDIGARQHEYVAVAFEIARVRAEPFSPELLLRQLVALNHRPHRAVEDEDAVREKRVEPVSCCHRGFRPLAMSTVKGSPVLRVPTCTRT
jgi:hypothetical protein